MATELLMIREKNHLVPLYPHGLEDLQKIGLKEEGNVTITRPRNIGHHKKFFALLNIVYKAQNRYPTMDHMLDAVKIGIGHYDLVEIKKDNPAYLSITDLVDDILKKIKFPGLLCSMITRFCEDKPKLIFKLRSISFGNMNQDSFEEFYNEVVKLIITKILPGTDKADLEREVMDMLGEGV